MPVAGSADVILPSLVLQPGVARVVAELDLACNQHAALERALDLHRGAQHQACTAAGEDDSARVDRLAALTLNCGRRDAADQPGKAPFAPVGRRGRRGHEAGDRPPRSLGGPGTSCSFT